MLKQALCCGPTAASGGFQRGPFALQLNDDGFRIDPAQFCSMGKSTPFAGQTVYGRCVRNVCGGAVVWQDAQA